jgi:serine/threonine protein kinase/tetratricopeptide (TPR) repeat protein
MTEPSLENELFNEAAESFVRRLRDGEHPSLTEYAQKYPALAERIHKLFPALAVMEKLGTVEGESRDEPKGRAGARELAEIAATRIPHQLGEYRILREVGRGGMGIVYEAVQESLGRHVALKVLPFHGLLHPAHLERFRREARAAARLHHTNIVPVFGVGEHEGIHYYAMQFILGQGFDEVLREVRRLRAQQRGEEVQSVAASVAQRLLTGGFATHGPQGAPVSPDTPPRGAGGDIPARDDAEPASYSKDSSPASGVQSQLSSKPDAVYFRSVAQIGLQVAEAVEYAHGEGVLHRDIKPSNLLLDTTGRVWITDFGLAKTEESKDLTSPGDVVGTVTYMAPERFQAVADSRSDVYGIGITLYEMLTLRPAFEDRNRARLIERVSHEEPQRPAKIDARIPRDLETIVLKAIAKEPANRYATACDMGEDLSRFLADRPIRSRRTPVAERAWRWCRRNPAVAGLVALLILALVAGVAGVTWQWRRAEGNLQAALRQQARADSNARKARQAFEEAFTRVSESKLVGVPGVQPLRQELLEAAQRYYRDFVEEARADPELQADLAAAHFRVASIDIFLDQGEAAGAALKEGVDLVERLLQEHPENQELPKRLAGFLQSARRLHSYASHMVGLSRDDATLLKAIALWERFARAYPDVRGFQSDLALLYLLRVEQLRDNLGTEEGLGCCQKARVLTENLVREVPSQDVYQHLLDHVYTTGAELLRGRGRQQDAEALRRQAVAFFEQQAAKHPDSPHLRFKLADMLNDLGHFLRETGRSSEAQNDHMRAIHILEQLNKQWPARADYQFLLARTYCAQGQAYFIEQLAEREQAFRQGITISQKLAMIFPDVPDYQQEWAVLCEFAGDALARGNRIREAEEMLRQGAQLQENTVRRYPEVPSYAHNLWGFRQYLALLLVGVGRAHEAEPMLQQSREQLEQLTAEHPKEPRYRVSLAEYELVLGHLLTVRGAPQEAAEPLRRCAELIRGQPVFFRDEPGFRAGLDYRTSFLLELLNRAGRYTEIEIIRRHVIDILTLLTALHPSDAGLLAQEAKHRMQLAAWLRGRDRPQAAEDAERCALDCYRRLLSRFPSPQDHAWLSQQAGDLLRAGGRPLEAAVAYKRAFDGFQLLARNFPHEAVFQRQRDEAAQKQGDALRTGGRLREAEKVWSQIPRP